jgi:peptide/nickel transport system permease protein
VIPSPTGVVRRRPARQSQVLGRVGLVLVAAVIAVALLGPLMSHGSSYDFVGVPFAPPSSTQPLGTDVLGRNALTRLLNGGYTILGLSAAATITGVSVGASLGIVAAYRGGWVDECIMRVLDVLLAFPQVILALVVLSILGSALPLIILVVAATHAPQVARVARAATLRTKDEDYVRFAEMIGVPKLRIICVELLPNIATPLAVEFGLRLTFSIALIAGLNFIGMGLQPPAPDWGLMINENRIGVVTNPWPIAVPVILISVLTIGINLTIDSWLRHRTNGKHSGSEPISLHGEQEVQLAATALDEVGR